MKKLFLSLLLMLLPFLASSQTFVKSFKDLPTGYGVSGELTLKDHVYFYSVDIKDNPSKVTIYNEKYEVFKVVDLASICPKVTTSYKNEYKDGITGDWIVENAWSEASTIKQFKFNNHKGLNFACSFLKLCSAMTKNSSSMFQQV